MWELPNRGDRAGVGEPLLQLLPPRPGFLPMPPTLRRGAPGAPGSQAQGAALRGSPHKGGGFEGSKSAGGNQVRFLVFTDPGSEEPLLARVPPPCCVSSPAAEPDQGGGEHGLPERSGVCRAKPRPSCAHVYACVCTCIGVSIPGSRGEACLCRVPKAPVGSSGGHAAGDGGYSV